MSLTIRMTKWRLIASIGVAACVIGIAVWRWGWSDRIPPDAFKLIPMHQVVTDRAIVFIHGLDGDPIETFRAKGYPSWFELMKADQQPFPNDNQAPPLSGFAIYSLDYRRVFVSHNTIEQAAVQIADLLQSDGIFRRYNHVFLVTHSLGGVLLKRVTMLYAEREYRGVIRRIAAVFLLAVPSRGSPLANLAASDIGEALSVSIGKRYRMVDDLQPERASAFLDSQENSWFNFLKRREHRDWLSTPFIYCAYEVDRTRAVVKVVQQLFAVTTCDEMPFPMSRDHETIVKPVSQSDQPYSWVRERIGRTAEKIKLLPVVTVTVGLESLGGIVAQYATQERASLGTDGIPEISEAIRFKSVESKSRAATLGLARRSRAAYDYGGPTVADVLERIAEKNTCVLVGVSRDRRVVEIEVTDKTRPCARGRSIRFVCAEVECFR